VSTIYALRLKICQIYGSKLLKDCPAGFFTLVLLMILPGAVFGFGAKRDSTQKLKRTSHIFISANFDKGSLLYPDNRYKDQILERIYHGSEIRVGMQTKTGNYYDQLYKFPSFGFGYYMADLSRIKLLDQNSETIVDQGYPNAFFGFIKVPLIRGKRLVWNYQFGGGLSFNFKPYHPESNPGNILIGSQRNVYFEVGSSIDLLLTNRIGLSGGYVFKHFSNGAYRIPNLGINLVAFQMALRYNFTKEKRMNLNSVEIPILSKKNEVIAFAAAGAKMLNEDFNEQIYDKQWFQTTVQLGYMRRIGWKRSWGGGFDIIYKSYGNYLKEIEAEKNQSEFNARGVNNFAMAVWAGHEVRYNRVSVHLQCAAYLFNNSRQALESPVYFRIGARYNVYKNFLIGVNLKSHGAKADVLEYAIGYRLGW
jgi:hypothetical protein